MSRGHVAARVTRVAFLVTSLTCFAFGQSERGTITGIVQDSSGAVIPAAKVTVTSQATNAKLDAVTNQVGEYTVPSVQPGVYNVRVDKQGFRPTEEKGISVAAAITVRADLKLEVGTSTQTIEVQAAAKIGRAHV